MVSDSRQRLEMEAALRGAIERDELVLHYQPIFFLQSGRICGVEALVRWEHPRYGHLLPQHFIPLAEETGLIVKLGGWVLHQACRQVQQWREAYPADRLTVSVNISGRQLQEPELVDEARGALADTGVDPDALVLEITESVLMQQTGSVLEQLQDMKALGVQLAIDDFGTGYSSLSYLQRFPIDILKIAKPFIDDVGAGIEKSALARAIIGLGDTLEAPYHRRGDRGGGAAGSADRAGLRTRPGLLLRPAPALVRHRPDAGRAGHRRGDPARVAS